MASLNRHSPYVTFPTGRLSYPALVALVMERGEMRKPRGIPTLDVGYMTIELDSPYNALAVGVGRNLSRKVAAAEAAQLIGAFSVPALLIDAAPVFTDYLEDDGQFWGAYGHRIGTQLTDVFHKLQVDPDTRQAVIALWDPALDNQAGKRDYPCTLHLVLSRDARGFLELDVTMRSNDVWRGFPYDIFQFTQLQLTLARVLGWEPGRYRHHTHSLHLYLDDFDAAKALVHNARLKMPKFIEELPTGFGSTNPPSLQDAMNHAHYVTTPGANDVGLTESELWYWHVLRGHTPELTSWQ